MLNKEEIITLIKNNRSISLLLFCAIILSITMIILAVFSLTNSSSQEGATSTPVVKDTVTPLPILDSNLTPTPTEPTTNPPVQYEDAGQSSLLNKVENRITLSQSDTDVKNKLISSLPSGSGTLYQSANVSIEYLSSPDIFQVEILTTNIDQAKREANSWLLLQGFSQNAICNYPVQFYLNFDIAQQLQNKNITFSPLAPGCN